MSWVISFPRDLRLLYSTFRCNRKGSVTFLFSCLCKWGADRSPAQLPGLRFALVMALDDIRVPSQRSGKDWDHDSGCFVTS